MGEMLPDRSGRTKGNVVLESTCIAGRGNHRAFGNGDSLPCRVVVGRIEDTRVQTILRTRFTFADGATKMAKVFRDEGCMAPSLVNPRFLKKRGTYDSPHHHLQVFSPPRLGAPTVEHPRRGTQSGATALRHSH